MIECVPMSFNIVNRFNTFYSSPCGKYPCPVGAGMVATDHRLICRCGQSGCSTVHHTDDCHSGDPSDTAWDRYKCPCCPPPRPGCKACSSRTFHTCMSSRQITYKGWGPWHTSPHMCPHLNSFSHAAPQKGMGSIHVALEKASLNLSLLLGKVGVLSTHNMHGGHSPEWHFQGNMISACQYIGIWICAICLQLGHWAWKPRLYWLAFRITHGQPLVHCCVTHNVLLTPKGTRWDVF